MSLSRLVTHTESNRLKDVFQQREQGVPIAHRLARNSTSAQASFPDDPHSTWGFDPLGCPQKPAGQSFNFNELFTWMATLFTQFDRPDVPRILAKDIGHKLTWVSACNKVMEEIHSVSSYDPDTRDTNYIRVNAQSSAALAHQGSRLTAKVEEEQPVVEATTSDLLEAAMYGWTRSGFKARAAARIFSEDVYADH